MAIGPGATDMKCDLAVFGVFFRHSYRCRGTAVATTEGDCFRVAPNPPRIDAKRENHSPQADFLRLIGSCRGTT